MGNKPLKYLYLMTAVLGILFSKGCKCHKDPDPCKDLKPVTADFRMDQFDYGNGYGKYWVGIDYPDTDTSIGVQMVFDPRIKDAGANNYTWLIGAGVYHTNKLDLNFSGVVLSQDSFPVTLIIYKQPNTACFPNDDGRDTLTRNLVFRDKSLVNGKFEGHWEDAPNNTFVMEIICPKWNRTQTDQFMVFYNYNSKGDSTAVMLTGGNEADFRYNAFVVRNNLGDMSQYGKYDVVYLNGVGIVRNHNDITIDYTYRAEKNNVFAQDIYKKFIGKRIN